MPAMECFERFLPLYPYDSVQDFAVLAGVVEVESQEPQRAIRSLQDQIEVCARCSEYLWCSAFWCWQGRLNFFCKDVLCSARRLKYGILCHLLPLKDCFLMKIAKAWCWRPKAQSCSKDSEGLQWRTSAEKVEAFTGCCISSSMIPSKTLQSWLVL